MEDLRDKIEQHSKQWNFTKANVKSDLKWGLRAVLVIIILVLLKYIGQ
jgi:hypothetical protein